MEYLLLIYAEESVLADMAGDDLDALMASYRAMNDEMRQAGVLRGASRLHDTPSATTVRVRGDASLTTDGPFAETKEALAGFYRIECDSLDDALRWAARVPGARIGSVEVRPIAYDVDPGAAVEPDVRPVDPAEARA